ncbi:MAG: putative maltokinase, partial [Bryobacteraceae bacterium]
RNGVRTPMQWSGDRNAGFSRATPARLFSPVIMDPVYGYDALNVEQQQSDASSLLNWTSNMIALRKLFRVFGRGTIEFLHPANRKVLAYLRRSEDEQVLCVANLSRFAQPVELDLPGLEGIRPVEMLGYVEFPLIGKQAYPLTLGPYGFLWFELQKPPEPVEPAADESGGVSSLDLTGGWETLLSGSGRVTLERVALPAYLPKQRWFGGKSRRIAETSITDWTEFAGPASVLALVEVRYEDGSAESYFLAVGMSFAGAADAIRSTAPAAVLCEIVSNEGAGVLYDAVLNDEVCAALLACIDGRRELRTHKASIRGVPSSLFAEARGPAETPLPPVRGSAEQSNSSILFGNRLILKLFRRQEPGPNPDCEIGRYLTEQAGFTRIPPFVGAIEYVQDGAPTATLAMLQQLVANEGDGWRWNLEQLERYYEDHARLPFPADAEVLGKSIFALSEAEPLGLAADRLGLSLDSAATLGRRTAEMHVALAGDIADPAFSPEPLLAEDLRQVAGGLRDHAARVLDLLKENLSRLPDERVESGALVLSRRRYFVNRFRILEALQSGGMRTRIHGDYHLGQVLRVKHDYVILDFEGEPARSLAERRAKHSPLKDVAGMLRSFGYAAQAALFNYTGRRPDTMERLEPWARLWEQTTAAEFLRQYRITAAGAAFLPGNPVDFQALLEAYTLDKALYELQYELNNRPAWVRIPLSGILSV